MGRDCKLSILSAAVLGLIVASVYGDTYSYSYTFAGDYYGAGTVATGTFDGTANGNLITGISNASVSINGTSIGGTIFPGSWNGSTWVDGGAIVSFDGTQSNFLFINSDYGAGDYSYTGYFDQFPIGSAHSGNTFAYAVAHAGAHAADRSVGPSWIVTDLSATQSVPDGGATIALLGGAVLGLAAFRCRFVS